MEPLVTILVTIWMVCYSVLAAAGVLLLVAASLAGFVGGLSSLLDELVTRLRKSRLEQSRAAI
jgi:hypothetical protein